MSKRISKETRRRLKRNRKRKYRRKMALRNQPRTIQERADVSAQDMREEDGDGSVVIDFADFVPGSMICVDTHSGEAWEQKK